MCVVVYSLLWHLIIIIVVGILTLSGPASHAAHTRLSVRLLLCVRQLKWPKFSHLLGFWKTDILLSLSLSVFLSAWQSFLLFFFFPSLILLVALILWLTEKKRANTPSETPRNNCSAAESWVCLRNSTRLGGNLELLCWNTVIFPRQTADPLPVGESRLSHGRCGAGTDAPKRIQGTKKKGKEVSLSPKTFCGMSLSHRAEG